MFSNRVILAEGGRKLDRYTKALLHFNGVDGSTNFRDESGKIWTPSGNAQIKTDQSKFGGASGYFDGTNSYISTPAHSDFDFGLEDFTIDFWARLQSGITDDRIVLHRKTPSGINGSPYFKFTYVDSSWIFTAEFEGADGYLIKVYLYLEHQYDIWYHIAIVRNGSYFRIYRNGTQGDYNTSSQALAVMTSPLSIGKRLDTTGTYFKGWIDEMRISKGIARWTSNFTPPTKEY
ncbi:MAG: LamG domain-containing protein [Clostridiaceae bacterium]|nr:LamG domain-containing protein [Clostridiaceae bacterium]